MEDEQIKFDHLYALYKDEDEYIEARVYLSLHLKYLERRMEIEGFKLNDYQLLNRSDWSELTDLNGKKNHEEKVGSVALHSSFNKKEPLDGV